MWHNMLFEPDPSKVEPDLIAFMFPNGGTACFVHPEAGVTYILGTDYFGEDKNLFKNGPSF